MTNAERRKRYRNQLLRALACLKRMPCQFWACDGPDAPYEDMKTCHRCAVIQDIRRTLKRTAQ